jgi:hypothetical protein
MMTLKLYVAAIEVQPPDFEGFFDVSGETVAAGQTVRTEVVWNPAAAGQGRHRIPDGAPRFRFTCYAADDFGARYAIGLVDALRRVRTPDNEGFFDGLDETGAVA